ncbi:MAG: hypothetical protein ACXWLB_08545 [Reyranella sp.]
MAPRVFDREGEEKATSQHVPDTAAVNAPRALAARSSAVSRAKKAEVQGFGLSLSLAGKGNNGHFAPFAWAA